MEWVEKLLIQKLLGIKTPTIFNMEKSSNHLFYPHQHFQPAFPTHLTVNTPYQMPYDPSKSLLSCKALLGSSENWSQLCHTLPPLWIKVAHVRKPVDFLSLRSYDCYGTICTTKEQVENKPSLSMQHPVLTTVENQDPDFKASLSWLSHGSGKVCTTCVTGVFVLWSILRKEFQTSQLNHPSNFLK